MHSGATAELRDVALRDALIAAVATGSRVLVLPPISPTPGAADVRAWSDAIRAVSAEVGAVPLQLDLADDAGGAAAAIAGGRLSPDAEQQIATAVATALGVEIATG